MTRKRDAEEGFTLIELMVVVLIIAILIAIAVPTFLGARRRAEDKAAQSNLRTGLVTAKVVYTDRENYTFATAATLTPLESSLDFVDGGTPSTRAKEVSVQPRSTNFVVLATVSKSGKCFYLGDDQSSGGTLYYIDASALSCMASSAPPQGDVAWTSGW